MENDFINLYLNKILENLNAFLKQNLLLETQVELNNKKLAEADKTISEKNKTISDFEKEIQTLKNNTVKDQRFAEEMNRLNGDILQKDQIIINLREEIVLLKRSFDALKPKTRKKAEKDVF